MTLIQIPGQRRPRRPQGSRIYVPDTLECVALGLGLGSQYETGPGGPGGGAAPPPYDPTMTTGLRDWWNPDLGVTNAAGKASAIADQGPSALAASQATAGSQPTITANAANGHTALTYSANQALDTAAVGLTGDVAATLVVVVAPTSASVAYAVCGFGTTGLALGAFSFWLNAAAVGQASLECSGGNGARFTSAIGTGYQVFVIRKAAGPLNTATVMYRNGAALTIAASSASAPNVGASGIRLGGFAPDNVANLYSGGMGDVLLYTGDVGDVEAGKLSTFFKTKYNVP